MAKHPIPSKLAKATLSPVSPSSIGIGGVKPGSRSRGRGIGKRVSRLAKSGAKGGIGKKVSKIAKRQRRGKPVKSGVRAPRQTFRR